MTNPASFRFDPWALLVGVVVLALSGIAFEHRDAIAEVLGPTDDATVTDVSEQIDEPPLDDPRRVELPRSSDDPPR